jgi:hypothetical protein
MKLMSIRDSPNGFNLLLQKPAGGAWPLGELSVFSSLIERGLR